MPGQVQIGPKLLLKRNHKIKFSLFFYIDLNRIFFEIKINFTFDNFNLSKKIPVSNEILVISANGLAVSLLIKCRILSGMLLGPVALPC